MKIIVLISLVLQSLIFGKCLDINEKNRLEMALENFKSSGFYQDVPNYIQCNHKKTSLEKLVCENPDLLLMFNVLSKVNVSKMEEYFKQEYNHKSLAVVRVDEVRAMILNGNKIDKFYLLISS